MWVTATVVGIVTVAVEILVSVTPNVEVDWESVLVSVLVLVRVEVISTFDPGTTEVFVTVVVGPVITLVPVAVVNVTVTVLGLVEGSLPIVGVTTLVVVTTLWVVTVLVTVLVGAETVEITTGAVTVEIEVMVG